MLVDLSITGAHMRPAALVALCLCVCSTANAAEIELADGSVVVGSILRLENGEDLVVDTAHMDEVVIAWDAITQMRNTKVVDVELFDGTGNTQSGATSTIAGSCLRMGRGPDGQN